MVLALLICFEQLKQLRKTKHKMMHSKDLDKLLSDMTGLRLLINVDINALVISLMLKVI
jgi:hypothetical protein